MSSLRYCFGCGEACEGTMLQTDQKTDGFLTSSTVTQGVAWCVNDGCVRFGLLAALAYDSKPEKAELRKHAEVTDMATTDPAEAPGASNPPKENP